MTLTTRVDGTTSPSIVTADWWNDYKNLLTGIMNDQPVTISNNLTLQDVAPSSPSMALVAGTALGVGVYTYALAYGNILGQSLPGPTATITTTTSNQDVTVTLAAPPAGVTTVYIYRSKVGATQLYLLTSVASTVTSYSDTTADASLSTTVPVTYSAIGGNLLLKTHAGTNSFGVETDSSGNSHVISDTTINFDGTVVVNGTFNLKGASPGNLLLSDICNFTSLPTNIASAATIPTVTGSLGSVAPYTQVYPGASLSGSCDVYYAYSINQIDSSGTITYMYGTPVKILTGASFTAGTAVNVQLANLLNVTPVANTLNGIYNHRTPAMYDNSPYGATGLLNFLFFVVPTGTTTSPYVGDNFYINGISGFSSIPVSGILPANALCNVPSTVTASKYFTSATAPVIPHWGIYIANTHAASPNVKVVATVTLSNGYEIPISSAEAPYWGDIIFLLGATSSKIAARTVYVYYSGQWRKHYSDTGGNAIFLEITTSSGSSTYAYQLPGSGTLVSSVPSKALAPQVNYGNMGATQLVLNTNAKLSSTSNTYIDVTDASGNYIPIYASAFTTGSSASLDPPSYYAGYDLGEAYNVSGSPSIGTVVAYNATSGLYETCTTDADMTAKIVSSPGFQLGQLGVGQAYLALVGKVAASCQAPIPIKTWVTANATGGVRAVVSGESVLALGYVIEEFDSTHVGIALQSVFKAW